MPRPFRITAAGRRSGAEFKHRFGSDRSRNLSTVAEKEAAAQVAPKVVVALLHVADVQRSIEFYEKLGFEAGNEPLKNDQGTKTFVWMHHGNAAQIMLTLSSQPLNPGARDIMF
jgi:hypothetical protein